MVIDKTEKTEKPEIVEGLIKNAKDQKVETKALTPKKEEVKIATEMNNTAGKIINAQRVQLEYADLRKEQPDIDFMKTKPKPKAKA